MLTEKGFNTGVVSLNYAEGPTGGAPLVLLHGVTTCLTRLFFINQGFGFFSHAMFLSLE